MHPSDDSFRTGLVDTVDRDGKRDRQAETAAAVKEKAAAVRPPSNEYRTNFKQRWHCAR